MCFFHHTYLKRLALPLHPPQKNFSQLPVFELQYQLGIMAQQLISPGPGFSRRSHRLQAFSHASSVLQQFKMNSNQKQNIQYFLTSNSIALKNCSERLFHMLNPKFQSDLFSDNSRQHALIKFLCCVCVLEKLRGAVCLRYHALREIQAYFEQI